MTYYPPPGAADSPPPQDPAPGSAPGPAPGSWPPPSVPGAWGGPTAGPVPPPGPGWGAPGRPPWGPPVHQPGVVPLRPLTLGDIYGGALQTVRRNPKATVGLAALVTFGFMVIPTVITVLLGAGNDLPSLEVTAEDSGSIEAGNVGLAISTVVSAVFSLLSSIVVTGLIVRVVEQALVGRKISAGETWRLSRGRLLPLLGLTLLVLLGTVLVFGVPIAVGIGVGIAAGSTTLAVLLAVLGGLAAVVGAVFLYTRYVLLAAPCLVLEGRGVLASFARAGQLSRRDFWRLFGIYLLASVITSFVGQVIAIPFGILGFVSLFALPDGWGLVGMLLISNVSTVLTGALVGPFTSAVMALQYYDQRFRKEGLDIALLNQSLQSGPR